MRFLADESCDFAVVRALRRDGHDVLAVSEFQQRSIDQEVMEIALRDNRLLLTEDKDFGRLVFAARVDSPGVILIRFPAPARRLLAEAVQRLVAERGAQLKKAFVVLQPGSIRISTSRLDAGDDPGLSSGGAVPGFQHAGATSNPNPTDPRPTPEKPAAYN
jgi:predicted nuclease of predicted toxin-antitoxin system